MATELTAANSLLGGYEASKASSSTTSSNKTDKDMFLTLLVAQLTHQDPLNPADDTEFLAQLAQFTQVEELQNIGTNITAMQTLMLQETVASASSLIGMLVSAVGDNITKSGDYVSDVSVTIPQNIASGTINVYAVDSAGNIKQPAVFTDELGAVPAGVYPYTWPGTDNKGNAQADGSYIVTVTGVTPNGNKVLCEFSSVGLVTRVETAADGNHILHLNDGRTVNFNNVEVITYYAGGSTDPDPDDDTGGENGGETGGETGGENGGETGEVTG